MAQTVTFSPVSGSTIAATDSIAIDWSGWTITNSFLITATTSLGTQTAFEYAATGDPIDSDGDGFQVVGETPGGNTIIFNLRSLIGWDDQDSTMSVVVIADETASGPDTYRATYTISDVLEATPTVTHTQDGLGRMLDQFQGSVNLRLLAASYLDQVQAFENAAYPIINARNIVVGSGDRLDGLGRITNQFRSGLSDDDYRQQLQAELAVLRSQGTAEEILTIAQLLIEMTVADYEMYELYPKALYLRPVDHVLTQDASTIGAKLKRAVSATTDMLFVWSRFDDSATYQLSSSGSVETSSLLGLADTPTTVSTWDYRTATTGDPAASDFRFNHSNIIGATEMVVSDFDNTFTSRITLLDDFDREVLYLETAGGDYINLFVTSQSNDTGHFTYGVEVDVATGTFTDGESVTFKHGDDGGRLAGAS